MPNFLFRLVGLAVGLTLILACAKLDSYAHLHWWAVFSPLGFALFVHFAVLSVAIALWIHVAVLFVTGNIDCDPECELRLDVLFRSAKICFLGHGYVVLLILSLGMFLLKMHFYHTLPIAYPLLPIIILGMVHIFLALIFKQPEVHPASYFLIGMTLVGQSIMLVVKIDHYMDLQSIPWAVTFTPSWLTYVLLLIYCVASPLQCFQAADEEVTSASSSSYYSSHGGADNFGSNRERIHLHLLKVSGIACWSIGWGAAQVLLTLRLDLMYKVSWLGVIVPAFLGWVLLLVFINRPVDLYFRNVAELLFATFSLINHQTEEQEPLLGDSERGYPPEIA